MSTKIIAICVIALYILVCQPALAIDQSVVTVNLFEAHRPLRSLEIFPPFEIVRDDLNPGVDCRSIASARSGKVILKKDQGDQITIVRARSLHLRGSNGKTIALAINYAGARRKYHGDILLSVNKDNYLEIINHVGLSDYLTDVVASETPIGAPVEALKAQAVLCQTRLYQRKKPITIGDSTADQCYLGASLETAAVRNAVNLVYGKFLYYNSVPATVFYHATCAGGTSDGAKYFDLPKGSPPYLCAVPCKYCSDSPFWRTTSKRIPGGLFAKEFDCVIPEILEQDHTGRPLSLRLADGGIISGYNFWMRLGQRFGWDKCPGTRYKLIQDTNGDIIIKSTGAGHGIGLCQWGATELARRGKNYQQILQYYFPACVVR